MEIDHQNIVKLEGVYESEDCIHLVHELCSGGDLFDRLDAQPEEHYSEAQCARLVKQMLSAARSIAQRDLKLDFVLFDSPGPDAELKMIDFGLSKHFKCGTRGFEKNA
jgi:calcium-dependent protein kinase